MSRRSLFRLAGLSATALLVTSRPALARTGEIGGSARSDKWKLLPDPGELVDLPRTFQYRVISSEGSRLSDGQPVPGDPDGMAAFRGPGGTTVLVRNHELGYSDGRKLPVVGSNPYDREERGGTTTILVGDDHRKIRDYVSSSGTRNNCAGGATPWGTWLTCEEDRTTNHGYVFEVDPRDPENDLSKTPIRGMGFFSHEAVDIDPQTGIAYLTEDDFRGRTFEDPNRETATSRVSFVFRYVPDVRSRKRGALQRGGKLEVLAIEERRAFNADMGESGEHFGVIWKRVNPKEPHSDAERKGGTRFNRLEGAHFAGGAFWFDDTMGGEERLGQIFRYIPETDTLELFLESTRANQMESPDNIVVTPWGDIWFAEDEVTASNGTNRIVGATPEGETYVFARNRIHLSEFAGPAFSPDGQTLFVNTQNPDMTLAIWGPFPRQDTVRQRHMAYASPPERYAPLVDERLTEYSERHGVSRLEAAAYDRLGLPLT